MINLIQSHLPFRLTAFNIEVGTEDNSGGERAIRVEDCNCPLNYVGLSCEECAPGYYRTTAGPFGGHCVPCNCHRHTGIAKLQKAC